MLQFTGKRSRGKYFGDRSDFLSEHAPDLTEAWLCHSVEGTRGSLAHPSWVTLVLGSGCLEALDAEDRAALGGLASAVIANLGNHPGADDWFEGDAEGALRRFVARLVADRVDPKYRSDAAAAPAVTDDAASLVLLAALMTRLYHRIKASEVTALTRSGDEVATMDRRAVWWPPIKRTLVEPAVRIADELGSRLGDDPVSNLVKDVLGAVKGTISPSGNDPARVALWHLALLTECAWYLLTQHTSVYPGWSDLLLTLAVERSPLRREELALSTRDGLLKLRSGLPRPAFAHQGLAAEAVRGVFEPRTRVSWDRSQAGKASSDRSRLYAACAKLLNAQAAEAASTWPQQLRPPVASAFVTTFDLELEMALLRAAASPFLVVVPFHVLVGGLTKRADVQSHPAWLAYVVRPDIDGVDDLLKPSEWVVLRSDLFQGVAAIPVDRDESTAVVARGDPSLRFGNLPVVVRLSGSPLVTPPPLYDQATNRWTPHVDELKNVPGTSFRPPAEPSGNPRDPGIAIEHAVVIDEYAAMQQTAAELFTPEKNARIGLPTELAGGKGDRARFWMLLGVQVSDPGMRHRVAFQMSAPALTGLVPLSAPTRPGVVVNRRLTSEDQELLHWFGFDVVHGRCQDFVEDLERVAAHHVAGWWHPVDADCTITP